MAQAISCPASAVLTGLAGAPGLRSSATYPVVDSTDNCTAYMGESKAGRLAQARAA